MPIGAILQNTPSAVNMLRSLLSSRPFATFDASNKMHRNEYYKFIETNTWSKCPVQFTIQAPYAELPHEINNKLVRYYLTKEFDKKGKSDEHV